MMDSVKPVGRPPKYDFEGLQPGEIREYDSKFTDRVINCANSYARIRGLDWQVKAWKERNKIFLIRIR